MHETTATSTFWGHAAVTSPRVRALSVALVSVGMIHKTLTAKVQSRHLWTMQ